MSVAGAGRRAARGTVAARVHTPYGGQIGVMQDGQLQGQSALYAVNTEPRG